ncbi:GNAT family N-acetyltransferase [Shewanella sp. AS1]|uniref:GNAT family N-acetyltransferase n=1 Tax=Shewanella sp. AS1 TaxID=2907626 RepID=UPI001F4048F8|nr:GNAT family N-acetyltransferase [Shewanella sp. AS1]MCE9679913.1 GNAT family N-acetyltransferase [Shewanella sp. AS1]
MNWQDYGFAELTTKQLYQLLKTRVDIFVVEQNCPYPELDGKDCLSDTRHLLATDEQGSVLAYARVLAPGVSYSDASIGRVLVVEAARNQGLAFELMQRAIAIARRQWPQTAIQIGAQAHLQGFYQGLGFVTESAVYLEDGIPHVDMRLAAMD